jgi:hypothetical protein
MALSKIQAESMNLADTYAFTGTVSGAGDVSNLVQIGTYNMSGTAYGMNPIFTSSYDTYLVIFDNIGTNSGGSHFKFKFYNDTGATSDNVYRGYSHIINSNSSDVSQVYQNSYPWLTVTHYGGTSQGAGGYLWVHQPLNSLVMTTFNYHIPYYRNDGYGATCVGGGMATDFGTRTHTGFYFFLDGGASFGGRAKVTIYGVKRS